MNIECRSSSAIARVLPTDAKIQVSGGTDFINLRLRFWLCSSASPAISSTFCTVFCRFHLVLCLYNILYLFSCHSFRITLAWTSAAFTLSFSTLSFCLCLVIKRFILTILPIQGPVLLGDSPFFYK